MRMRKMVGALAFVALIVSGCGTMTQGETAMSEKTLYERLGGKPAITAVVDEFVANVAADKRVNSFFADVNIPRLKRLLVEQICQASGGPCKYSGRSMNDRP